MITRDIVARSEKWEHLRELCFSAPLRASTSRSPGTSSLGRPPFGSEGPLAQWWQLMYVVPCTKETRAADAESIIDRLEGREDSTRCAQQDARPGAPPRPDAPKKKEVCNLYNEKRGRCAKDGPCPFGRLHKCNVCGKPHRSADHHWDDDVKDKKGDKKKRR